VRRGPHSGGCHNTKESLIQFNQERNQLDKGKLIGSVILGQVAETTLDSVLSCIPVPPVVIESSKVESIFHPCLEVRCEAAKRPVVIAQ